MIAIKIVRPFVNDSHNKILIIGQFCVAVTVAAGYVTSTFDKNEYLTGSLLCIINSVVIFAAFWQSRNERLHAIVDAMRATPPQPIDEDGFSSLWQDSGRGPLCDTMLHTGRDCLEMIVQSDVSEEISDQHWEYVAKTLLPLTGADGDFVWEQTMPKSVRWSSLVETAIRNNLEAIKRDFGLTVVIYKGWLHKRGFVNKAFRRRFFVLARVASTDAAALQNGLVLFWWTFEDGQKVGFETHKGSIDMAQISRVSAKADPHLILELISRDRTWVLKAESHDDFVKWRSLLGGEDALLPSVLRATSTDLAGFRRAAERLLGPLYSPEKASAVFATMLQEQRDQEAITDRHSSLKSAFSEDAVYDEENPMVIDSRGEAETPSDNPMLHRGFGAPALPMDGASDDDDADGGEASTINAVSTERLFGGALEVVAEEEAEGESSCGDSNEEDQVVDVPRTGANSSTVLVDDAGTDDLDEISDQRMEELLDAIERKGLDGEEAHAMIDRATKEDGDINVRIMAELLEELRKPGDLQSDTPVLSAKRATVTAIEHVVDPRDEGSDEIDDTTKSGTVSSIQHDTHNATDQLMEELLDAIEKKGSDGEEAHAMIDRATKEDGNINVRVMAELLEELRKPDDLQPGAPVLSAKRATVTAIEHVVDPRDEGSDEVDDTTALSIQHDTHNPMQRVEELPPQDECLTPLNFELGLETLVNGIAETSKPSAFDILQLLGADYHRNILAQQGARATNFMADPIWGPRLKQLKRPEITASMRQQVSLTKAGSLRGCSSFDGFDASLDEEVLPALMCAISKSALDFFEESLQQALCDVTRDGGDDDTDHQVDVKIGPIKRLNRVAVKVGEYREEKGGEHWPHSSFVTDILRASYICEDARSMMQAFEGLSSSEFFQVVRLKNKIGECKGPFNLHVNVIFSPPKCEQPILCEVQFYPRDVFALQHRQHLMYEVKRAPSIQQLL